MGRPEHGSSWESAKSKPLLAYEAKLNTERRLAASCCHNVFGNFDLGVTVCVDTSKG
jgi:hypothetical protein